MILALKKPRLVVDVVVVGEVQFNVLICKNIFYEKSKRKWRKEEKETPDEMCNNRLITV